VQVFDAVVGPTRRIPSKTFDQGVEQMAGQLVLLHQQAQGVIFNVVVRCARVNGVQALLQFSQWRIAG